LYCTPWIHLTSDENITLRFPAADLKLIDKHCKYIGFTRSGFIRVAVLKELARLGLLSASRTRALGIQVKDATTR